METGREQQLRDYAAGDLPWRTLNEQGMTYAEVLDGLGALGLRPPRVRPGGPNAAALQRGTAMMRMLLARQAQP